jgi:phage tail-like protein
MNIQREFKTQIIKTKDQWESGLLYRLDLENDKGASLFSVPTFTRWIEDNVIIDSTIDPVASGMDKCGNIYVIDVTCKFFYYDLLAGRRFEIPYIGGFGTDLGKFVDPKKIVFEKNTFWVLDKGRLQGFSRENYQIKYVIDKFVVDMNAPENPANPIDFVLDKSGNIYVLDEKARILKYDNHGNEIKLDESGFKGLYEPLCLYINKENRLFVLDKKCIMDEGKESKASIVKFSEDGKNRVCIENLEIHMEDDSSRFFIPSIFSIDNNGNFLIAEAKTEFIHSFDQDESYIGTFKVPDIKSEITGITIDPEGNIYVTCKEGIAFFSTQKSFTKERGFYYSKTLDNGKEKSQWHGISLEGNIQPKTIIEVYYYSDDDPKRKDEFDKILIDSNSIKNKKDDIEKLIPKWIGPEILSISEKREKKAETLNQEILDLKPEITRMDMLFRERTGRYLWLKIALSTVDETLNSSIDKIKVFYPRESYLRYLPAIFQENPVGQEDPVSRDFLERFLSIFETVFYDLETRIYDVDSFFDPDTAGSKIYDIYKYLDINTADSTENDFLKWLASWLNVAIEDEWDEQIKIRFIQEAFMLYRQKGTLAGIEKLIEIYTGKKPVIIEHSRSGKPMILNDKETFIIGINSLLLRTPVRGFRIGEDSILGRTAIMEGDLFEICGNPFLSLAHRFTVVVDLPAGDFALRANALKRILDREIPAHTKYYLRIVGETEQTSGLYVGMNTRLVDQSYYSLGNNSFIGSGVIVRNGDRGGRVDHSRLEKDTNLI